YLSHGLGQQVIVENVGAAAGIVGTNRVAKAPPDGYVFLYGTVGTHAYNPALYKKLPYNAATDFAPVVLFAEQPMVLVTRKDFPRRQPAGVHRICQGERGEAAIRLGRRGLDHPSQLCAAQ